MLLKRAGGMGGGVSAIARSYPQGEERSASTRKGEERERVDDDEDEGATMSADAMASRRGRTRRADDLRCRCRRWIGAVGCGAGRADGSARFGSVLIDELSGAEWTAGANACVLYCTVLSFTLM